VTKREAALIDFIRHLAHCLVCTDFLQSFGTKLCDKGAALKKAAGLGKL
jgi:hypothetical protein